MEENKIPEEYLYVSSDGTEKDVRDMDYQHLVNSLAKAHRNEMEVDNLYDFNKSKGNIKALNQELLERQNKRFNETFKESNND